MPKYRISYGLALCRRNNRKNNCIEILSIKKRYSYHYASFVAGQYRRNNDFRYIKYLFDNMTFQEKTNIISFDFSNMWWHLWLTNPEKGMGSINSNEYKNYFKKKIKFEKTFLHDNGKKLKFLINKSKNCEVIWEIPKGASEYNETELDTAIREFTEETFFNSTWYDIKYHVKPVIVSYKDNGIIYKNIYYLAALRNECEMSMNPKINYNSVQIGEVSDIRWLGINDIRNMDINTKNKKYMINLYQKIIDKYKKSFQN